MRSLLPVLALFVGLAACNEDEAPAAPAADEAAAAEAAGDEAAAAPATEGEAAAEAKADDGPPRGIKTEWTDFGQPWTVEAAVPVAQVLADPAAYVDKTVRVSGDVTDVCQKAGCWMVIAEGDQSIRVTMKDHGFGVYADGAGGDCEVEGTLVGKPLDPNQVAHFESESANPDAMPEKQVTGDLVYEIVASSVRMKKDEG